MLFIVCPLASPCESVSCSLFVVFFIFLSLLVNFHEIVVSGAVKTGLSVLISLISYYLILSFQGPFLVSTHCGACIFVHALWSLFSVF